jgi:DNA-binding NarL/FixJ family response regulator
MNKTIHTVIFEKDPFSRNWISLLFTRDRRTRVVGEVGELRDLFSLVTQRSFKVDLIVVDASFLNGDHFILSNYDDLFHPGQAPAVMVLGMSPDLQVLRRFGLGSFSCYLLKDEIGFSIAWAASLAFEGSRVVTPGIPLIAHSAGITLPRPYLVLDGRGPSRSLTEYQSRVARLAILYSMERRDLSDELGITDEWAYGLVSSLYEKLGLKDLLSDDLEPAEYFGHNPQILSFFQGIREEFKGSGKSRDMETLAFHLLSAPEILEIT